MADYPDPDVGRAIKESIDRSERAMAKRARAEAEARGEPTCTSCRTGRTCWPVAR